MSDDPLTDIVRKDPRYPRAAYEFLQEALAHTVASLGRPGHVSGRELCEGIRAYARAQFGPLARTLFASWNVRTTRDFGNLVWNLVEAGVMGRTEEDTLADFENVYRFEDAFPDDAGDVEVKGPDEDDV